jgi:Kef-type K+ transport system membrane component KefB
VERGVTHAITLLVLQFAFVLLIARIFGEFFERFFKQPGVLGELLAGVFFGPFLLGAKISLPGIGPMFPALDPTSMEAMSHIPISLPLYGIGQIAAVLLLFAAGLETNPASFIRFAGKASIVGAAGIVLPFVLGAFATVWFGHAKDFFDGRALFMGATMAATSVGITARVLSDLKKIDTPEGITILGAAVVDDVLGILVLAIVVNLAQSGTVEIASILWIAVKSIGIWLGLTAFFLIAAPRLAHLWNWFQTPGSSLVLTFIACLVAAVLCEVVGLAMIIGAYSVGLAFSNTKIAARLREDLRGVYHLFVPAFFVILGMLVNPASMKTAFIFGAVISVLAILGKVIGCGIAGFLCGFNSTGSFRIGIGMIPRGEVALIVAGYGLTRGVVDIEMFGIAVFMTLVTTVLAPIFLTPAFKNEKIGLKKHYAN